MTFATSFDALSGGINRLFERAEIAPYKEEA
jgi:hypothetical protein